MTFYEFHHDFLIQSSLSSEIISRDEKFQITYRYLVPHSYIIDT